VIEQPSGCRNVQLSTYYKQGVIVIFHTIDST